MLKKCLLLVFVLFVGLILITSSVYAITLSFDPFVSSIGIGELIDIDIVISELGLDKLSTFDFYINYDESILYFDGYMLGGELGNIFLGDALDLSWGDLGGGTINLAELSMPWADLSSQPDSFILATASFTGSSIGTCDLSFSDIILGDEGGGLLSTALNVASVTVTAPIPEPATCLLLLLGLIGMVGIKKRYK